VPCPPPGTSRRRRPYTVEHDRLVPVDEHAVVEVQAHGAGEHDFFEVAALAREIFD
jgi:hypothetical protein